MLVSKGQLVNFNKLIQEKTLLLGETVLWIFYGDCHYTSVCSYARGTNIAEHDSETCCHQEQQFGETLAIACKF